MELTHAIDSLEVSVFHWRVALERHEKDVALHQADIERSEKRIADSCERIDEARKAISECEAAIWIIKGT